MSDVTPDLDQLIVHAVNARIEAEVTKALSGDEVIGRLVSSALRQTVDSPNDFMRSRPKQSFLTSVLEKAIQAATKKAVAKVLEEEVESIEAAVRLALMANTHEIGRQLAASLAEAATKPYGVEVKVDLRMPSGN